MLQIQIQYHRHKYVFDGKTRKTRLQVVTACSLLEYRFGGAVRVFGRHRHSWIQLVPNNMPYATTSP